MPETTLFHTPIRLPTVTNPEQCIGAHCCHPCAQEIDFTVLLPTHNPKVKRVGLFVKLTMRGIEKSILALGFPSKNSAEIAPDRPKTSGGPFFAEFVGQTRKPASALKFTNIGGILKLPLESGGLDSPSRHHPKTQWISGYLSGLSACDAAP